MPGIGIFRGIGGKIIKLLEALPLEMWTVDSPGFEYSMTLVGTVDETITIDWGDDVIEDYIFTGVDQVITHTYAVGQFLQKWNVDKLSVTKINAGTQNLTGELPVALQGFYNLTDFRINANQFTGDLSSWDLSSWINITHFNIHLNQFTGDLSSWDLSNWTNITNFYIYSIQFTGDLSSWDLSNWTNITHFYIQSNQFTGDLSSWDLSNWTNIINFNIQPNQFTGDLSSWDLSNWTNITYFYIYSSQFTGDLSSWDLSNWTNIINFYIQSNQFTGLNNLTNDTFFDYRIDFTRTTKTLNVSDNSESLTGTYQQPDLGTYSGNINDLTEIEIYNLSIGTDYDGGGTNTVWSTLEQVWILELLEVSPTDSTKRYGFDITY